VNRRVALVVFALAVAGAAACGAKDIVVADVATDGGAPPSLDGGADGARDAAPADDASPPPGPSCKSNADCAPNEYCSKNKCGDAVGGCEQRPDLCDDSTQLHCGCDGVTYWNDCLRQRDGAMASTDGGCAVGAAPCDDNAGSKCPVNDAACARLVYGQACPQNLPGVCWVLPDQCPSPGPPGPMWLSCGGPNACTDLCGAISTSMPFQSAPPPGGCPSGPNGN
jgi:hypothetical protein